DGGEAAQGALRVPEDRILARLRLRVGPRSGTCHRPQSSDVVVRADPARVRSWPQHGGSGCPSWAFGRDCRIPGEWGGFTLWVSTSWLVATGRFSAGPAESSWRLGSSR